MTTEDVETGRERNLRAALPYARSRPFFFFFSIEFSDLILSTPKFNSANVVRAHKRHWSGKCIETIRLCGTEARNLVNCGTFNLDLFADGQ